MRNYKVHFIRHGLTQANIEGRYLGREDQPLCETGEEQLIYLAEHCRYPWVEKVYASPLVRCMQTAQLLFPGVQVQEVNELMEIDMGQFEGKTPEELESDEAYTAWLSDASVNPPPGGETTEGFLLRLVGAVNEIVSEMMQKGIFEAAVVTHGGAVMSLLSSMGLPKAPMEHWQCPAGSGFTVYITAAMWMRDSAFEIVGVLPDGIEKL